MGTTGLGVMIKMINMMFGDNSETVETIRSALGKVILNLYLEENRLHCCFSDGPHIAIWDDGQSCSESRYMATDDELAYFIGARLFNIEVRDAPNMPDEWGEHEVQFLVITTSLGAFTIANHNEHNGGYGGFWMKAAPVEGEKQR